MAEAAARVAALVERVQADLLAAATARRDAATADVTSLDDAADAAQSGFARVPWALVRGEGEAHLAGQGITVRCLVTADGGLPSSEDDDDLVAVRGARLLSYRMPRSVTGPVPLYSSVRFVTDSSPFERFERRRGPVPTPFV